MEVNSRWRVPIRFQVRWVGFTEADDTWVSYDNLSCDKLFHEFLEISGRKAEFEVSKFEIDNNFMQLKT